MFTFLLKPANQPINKERARKQPSEANHFFVDSVKVGLEGKISCNHFGTVKKFVKGLRAKSELGAFISRLSEV